MLETAAPILVQVLETKMVMAEASANVVGRTNCVRVRATPMRLAARAEGTTQASETMMWSGSASSEQAHSCEHETRAADVAIGMTAMKA
jgi:hypothetical protein